MPEKPHINLAFIGHVDHGKSTLVGRLLFEGGVIDKRIIDKYQEEAKAIGKESFKFAWVLDKLKEERKRGVTIDIGYNEFETPHKRFTIIDLPGHKDFLKNMITGTSDADAAVLVVDAREGPMPQTKEHIYLSKASGVDQIIVAVNKMDRINYEKQRFEEVKEEISKILTVIGFSKDTVFVPVSAFEGDNIMKKSENMKWYTGPTFYDALDSLKPPEKPTHLPLRIPVDRVFQIKGVGVVPIGKIETGVMKLNDKVVVQPSNKVGEVKSIEMHHNLLQKAEPGDNIGFNIRGISKDDIKRGDVIGHSGEKEPSVVTPKDSFESKIVVLIHPSGLGPGHVPTLFAHTTNVPIRIIEVISKINPKTGEELEKNPKVLRSGEIGIVVCQPLKSFVIEEAGEIPELSRFALREGGMTVAAGICSKIRKA